MDKYGPDTTHRHNQQIQPTKTPNNDHFHNLASQPCFTTSQTAAPQCASGFVRTLTISNNQVEVEQLITSNLRASKPRLPSQASSTASQMARHNVLPAGPDHRQQSGHGRCSARQDLVYRTRKRLNHDPFTTLLHTITNLTNCSATSSVT